MHLSFIKIRFNSDIGKFSFSNRVCDSWNHLPNDIVTASSLNINIFFKQT